MDIITLDFETYYDSQYSLSKITTEEYIRDPRFEAIGVAVKVNQDAPVWCTGDFHQLHKFLTSFNLPNCAVLAHNCMFDAAILSWRFNITPNFLLDTMYMSRAIRGVHASHSLKNLAIDLKAGEKGTEVLDAKGIRREEFDQDFLHKYSKYCVNDVELTKKVYDILSRGFPDSETKLIDLTLKMFVEPQLKLNKILLAQHLENTIQRKEKLLADSKYEKEVLMSNPKFAEVLRELGVEPPTKISPRTGKETFAFAKADEGFKELQEHPDVRVQTVVAARMGVKSTLEETRTQRFIDIADRGSLPIPLRYCAAHTTRWGGADKINLQNLPSRGVDANTLKKSIVAPKGYTLINTDSSQIEARTLAWLAGQNDVLESFRNKEDVYKIMASKIYNKPIDDIEDGERFIGKSVILGCGYGMGASKFQKFIKAQGVDIDEAFAEDVINTYRRVNPRIQNMWRKIGKVLHVMTNKDSGSEGYWPFPPEKPDEQQGSEEEMEAWRELMKVYRPKLSWKGSSFILPSGLSIQYPSLRYEIEEDEETGTTRRTGNLVYKSRRGNTYIYGAKSVENITQGVARCIIGEQMLQVAKRYRVVLTVHDAVTCVVRSNEVSAALNYIESCMRCTPKWAEGLPLDCESGVGKNYGDCK